MKRRRANLLANRTATVSVARNGLTIEVAGVPAADSARVAAAILDAVRGLVSAGYEELVLDAGSAHASPAGEVPDDDEITPAETDPPTAKGQSRRLGFIA